MKLNACVGRNGGRAGFDRFARGYFEAGDRLVASLQENPFEVDLLVYPIVMVYRHGIEAALKHLAKILPGLCGEPVQVRKTHKLLDNWNPIRRHLAQLGTDRDDLKRVDELLTNLVQIDPDGERFRYPESKDGAPHLDGTSLINLGVVAEEMGFLKIFFEGTCDWAQVLWDKKSEEMRGFREAEREMSEYFGM